MKQKNSDERIHTLYSYYFKAEFSNGKRENIDFSAYTISCLKTDVLK
jgi:hypothetical protein